MCKDLKKDSPNEVHKFFCMNFSYVFQGYCVLVSYMYVIVVDKQVCAQRIILRSKEIKNGLLSCEEKESLIFEEQLDVDGWLTFDNVALAQRTKIF